MDDDLIQRILLAETDLLVALQSGPQMLASYRQTLSALPDVLSTARKNGNVGTETLLLANSVASRISKIASCFLDVRRAENLSTTKLQRDCEAMIQLMAGLNLNLNLDDTSGSPCPPACPIKPSLNTEDSSPPFLTSAYRWLLDNLHNPYPTAEIKSQIAAASACQISSISSWFTNARRRIGWTTLCREHFSCCRADMIDAAHRALVDEDPQRTLSPELRHSFVAMKVAAEGLYSTTLTKSTFARDLDAIVTDVMNKDRGFVEVRECHQVKQANPTKTVQESYPSPDPSTTASPVPPLGHSVTDKNKEEEDVVLPISIGSKRRRSSIEPVSESSSTARRPMKRLRASIPSPTYFPSPPSSTDGIDIPSGDGSSEPSFAHSIQSETGQVPLSRQRCLSDADSTCIPERPRDFMVAPRLHTVLDPLPHSNTEDDYSINNWFNTNFDALFTIPPPVDATEPDSSASWEVELFRDYSIPGNPINAPTFPPTQITDSHAYAVTDLSDLDNLLQSLDGTFATPLGSMPVSDITGAPYAASFDSSMNMSQTEIDWTSLLDAPDAYQPTIHPTFPQYPTQPLPEIDLSMLQLPHVIPPVSSQSDFALKQAKLHQLHTMQEAVRRMEQELQLEGVIM